MGTKNRTLVHSFLII